MVKKMKSCIAVLGVYALSTVLLHADGILSGSEVSIGGNIDLFSSYVWRGFELDPDPVVQTGISVAYGGLSVEWLTSNKLVFDDPVNSSEIDYVVDYTYDFGGISVSAGHTFYVFPAADDSSGEFYIGGALDSFFSTALFFFSDYDEGDGSYVLAEVSRSEELGPSKSMDYYLSVGINDGMWIDGNGGDASAGLSFTFALFEGLDLTPSFGYVIPFGDMEEETDENLFFAGASLGFGF